MILHLNDKEIRIGAKTSEYNVEEITAFMDKGKFDKLCAEGCQNYSQKWSCPPFSPDYISFIHGYQYIYILILWLDICQMDYIKNSYLKIRAANSMLKSRLDKTLRQLIKDEGKYISTGSCRLCKPCKCKLDEPCAHPDKMSYSFEALGVNVDQMTIELMNHKLLWYKKGSIPDYTSVVGGILTNKGIDEEIILDTVEQFC